MNTHREKPCAAKLQVALIAPLLIALCLPCTTHAQSDASDPMQQLTDQCARRIRDTSQTWVECRAVLGTDARTRQELQARTAGLLQNAMCVAPVRFEREKLVSAMKSNGVLSIGKQDVQCDLAASGSSQPMKVLLQMVPTVAFKDGSVSNVHMGLQSAAPLPDFVTGALSEFLESDAVKGRLAQNLDTFLHATFPQGAK